MSPDRGHRPSGPDPRTALAPLERALVAHHEGRSATVRVHMNDGGVEDLPSRVFFRSGQDLRGADQAALELARGRVLDVGAGAGAVALALEAAGHRVTALAVLPGLVRVLAARGLRDARRGDLWTFRSRVRYDTVIALMNGTAAAGSLAGLEHLLRALAGPLAPRGQFLIDSTDLRTTGRPASRPDGRYVGELQYQLEYDGERGPPFPQLFVDRARLGSAARAVGLTASTVWRGEGGEYLARLVRG